MVDADDKMPDGWDDMDNIILRNQARGLIARWCYRSYKYDASYPRDQDRLAQLLGYKSYDHLLHGWNDETRRKLELLVGEHGYTIYKAMLARKEV